MHRATLILAMRVRGGDKGIGEGGRGSRACGGGSGDIQPVGSVDSILPYQPD